MMNMRALIGFVVVVSVVFGISGCAGTKTFGTAARAGDTVALAVGWNKNISRANLSSVITPATGSAVTYAVGDTNIRAVVNTYPDPMSRLVVGTETGQSLGIDAANTGNSLNQLVTGGDKDWAQTTVLLNLPTGIATGTATVQLLSGGNPVTASPLSVEILAGTGAANSFEGSSGGLSDAQLGTLERTSGSVVTLIGRSSPG